MIHADFKVKARQVATLLEKQGIKADVYQILNLTDDLVSGEYNFTPARQEPGHDSLVASALSSHEVMYALRDSRRIVAIKALRTITQCGLKAAKEATEDSRVLASVALLSDPWGVGNAHEDEPPF